MKKIFIAIIFIAIFYSVKINANPIVVYSAEVTINEVYYASNSDWFIELRIHIPDEVFYYPDVIDSMVLVTAHSHILLPPFAINETDFYIVINQNMLGDSLFVTDPPDNLELLVYGLITDDNSYIDHMQISSEQITWGNKIFLPMPAGQSQCYSNYFWYYDNSPTPGMPNDTVDATGMITGYLYDRDYNIVNNGLYYLQYGVDSLHFDSIGQFRTRHFARKTKYISIRTSGYSNQAIDSVTIIVNPHETSFQDIRMKNFLVGIPIIDNSRIVVLASPNPFSSSIKFYTEIDPAISAEKAVILIYNTEGVPVASKEISGNNTSSGFDFTGKSPGMYFYTLEINGARVKSGRIIYTGK
jgi:hypothetical protein